MKSSWFGDRARYDFMRQVQDADRNQQPGELFRIWLQAATASLRQATHKLMHGRDSIDPEIEQEYERAARRVKHPGKLADAMGQLVLSLEERSYDFLGMVSAEIGTNDAKWAGQCFTPEPLCEVMAQMTVGGMPRPEGRTVWFDEPACGGGAILIATANVLKAQGWGPRDMHFRATDVDRKCFQMTYIQTTLLGIPAIVVNGNTISLEEFDRARNMISFLQPPRNAPGEHQEAGEQKTTEETDAPPERREATGERRQLPLF